MISILIGCLYLVTNINGDLTPDEIDELRVDVIELCDTFTDGTDPVEDKPLCAAITRLAFHDCAGTVNDETDDDMKRGCNGCINMDQIDHAGLKEKAVLPLAPVFRKWQDRMSVSDFWASCGTIALEYANSLSGSPERLRDMPYFFGRRDCPMSPNARSRRDKTEFPMAHRGWDDAVEWFEKAYEYDHEEATAIIGCHTLGRAHKGASGFEGKWTDTPTQFDNSFYKVILDRSNQWDQVPNKDGNGFPMWLNKGKGSDKMMLTADIGLLYDVEDRGCLDRDTGEVCCRPPGFTLFDAPTCKDENSASIVKRFANNNQQFLDVFREAYLKMITHNQPPLRRVDARSFRDPRGNNNNNQNRPAPQPQPQPNPIPAPEPNIEEPAPIPVPKPAPVPVPVPAPEPVDDGNNGGTAPSRKPKAEWGKDTRCCDGFQCIREKGHQDEPQNAYQIIGETLRRECCNICQGSMDCESWTWDAEYNDCFLYYYGFQIEHATNCAECVSGKRIARG